jgi:hypothetical protein
MRRRTIQMVVALSLVAVGWVAGRAQTPAPEFTLAIEAPSGLTMVKCVQGCTLQGGRYEGNRNNTPTENFEFECGARPLRAAAPREWLVEAP